MDDSSNRNPRNPARTTRKTAKSASAPDDILDGDELVRRLFESSPPMAGDSEASLEMQREMMEEWTREAEEDEKAESEANEAET